MINLIIPKFESRFMVRKAELNNYMNCHKININFNEISIDTFSLFDLLRNRKIPVAIYKPKYNLHNRNLVVISHGYGHNKGGDYLAYSYLTEYLAINGYIVLSIQHELITDELLPLTGNPQIVRRPFWECGTDNIFFAINEIKRIRPSLSFNQITLIGHSNGGDMTAIFPIKYQNVVHKIITLDNRRMALPRTKETQVYSLRSSDMLADDGVLPTEDEQKRYRMKIIKLPNTEHNQMDDNANEKQRNEIRKYVLEFLEEK